MFPLGTQAQSLNDYVQSAVRTNPELKAERAAVNFAREAIIQAQANYRPEISILAETSFANRDAELSDGTTFSDSTRPSSASIVADQVLYAGGLRKAISAQAVLQQKIAEADYQARELEIALKTIDAFFAVCEGFMLINMEADYEKLIAEQLNVAVFRFEKGLGTKTEVEQVRASLALAQSRLLATQNQIEITKMQLERLSGLSPSVPPELPIANERIAIGAESVRQIVNFSPSLKSADLQIRLHRTAALSEKRRDSPQISLRFQASTSNSPSPAIKTDDDYRATLSFQLPLMNGLRTHSAVRQSLANSEIAYFEALNARRQIELDAETALLELESSSAQIAALKTAYTANENALTGVQEGQKAGIWSMLDVIDATERLYDSKRSLYKEKLFMTSQQSKLILLTGQFNDAY
jgi:Outer membrane protein